MKQIIIQIAGGCVCDIQGIPDGIEIVVHDFDTEGQPPDELETNMDGNQFIEAVYHAGGGE